MLMLLRHAARRFYVTLFYAVMPALPLMPPSHAYAMMILICRLMMSRYSAMLASFTTSLIRR